MRILHLLDHAAVRPTDYARRTLALLDGLRAQGVQTVHLTAPSALAPTVPAGWHFYATAPLPHAARLPRAWREAADYAALALRLRQVARLTRPDLIHVHAPLAQALAAWPAARLGRLPLLVEAERRGAATRALGGLERAALRRADALATGSIEQRAALRVALRNEGVGGRRIAVLPAAADLPGVARHCPGPPGLEGAPLLACAGSLDATGGIDLLLDALATLRRTRPALRLVVAGGGARLDALCARVTAGSLRGHVVFTGMLPGRRAADLLPRADIAVFPALPGAPGPSRHLLNAMAQGCAVLASDIDCHRELLVHGHSGMLFRAGSRASLVEALGGLLNEPLRLGALGAAAAGFIAARRSWPVTAARYRRLYADVLADAER